jgi:hypothetical protein
MASKAAVQMTLLDDAPALAIATAPRRPECIDQLSEWARRPENKRDLLAVHTRVHLNYTAGLERDLKLAESDLRIAYRDIDALERKLSAVPDAGEVDRLRAKLDAANLPMRIAAGLVAATVLAITLAVVL